MKKVLNVLYWLLILILIGVAVFVYKTKYFNDYIKIMKNPGSSFSRVTDIPEELLYEGEDALSYKIESDEYNNALFYMRTVGTILRIFIFLRFQAICGVFCEKWYNLSNFARTSQKTEIWKK